jgi:hypothetical protein
MGGQIGLQLGLDLLETFLHGQVLKSANFPRVIAGTLGSFGIPRILIPLLTRRRGRLGESLGMLA